MKKALYIIIILASLFFFTVVFILGTTLTAINDTNFYETVAIDNPNTSDHDINPFIIYGSIAIISGLSFIYINKRSLSGNNECSENIYEYEWLNN